METKGELNFPTTFFGVGPCFHSFGIFKLWDRVVIERQLMSSPSDSCSSWGFKYQHYEGKGHTNWQTWIMVVTWTLSGSANGIGLSKGGQAVQVERVAAVHKVPKNGVMANVNGWY
jgi:hypothetical protein